MLTYTVFGSEKKTNSVANTVIPARSQSVAVQVFQRSLYVLLVQVLCQEDGRYIHHQSPKDRTKISN